MQAGEANPTKVWELRPSQAGVRHWAKFIGRVPRSVTRCGLCTCGTQAALDSLVSLGTTKCRNAAPRPRLHKLRPPVGRAATAQRLSQADQL